MEIKVNKEIRSYQESIFFGLSMRQFFCALAAVGVAVIVYFSTKDILHKEIVGWLCIISAVPIAATGFITYHGLTFDKFLLKWVQSEMLNPKYVVFKADNIYKESMKGFFLNKRKKKKMKINDTQAPVIHQKDITSLVYKIIKNKADRIGYANIKAKAVSVILNVDIRKIKTALLSLEDEEKIVPYKRGYFLLKENERKEIKY